MAERFARRGHEGRARRRGGGGARRDGVEREPGADGRGGARRTCRRPTTSRRWPRGRSTRFGAVHVLCNNAGVGAFGRSWELTRGRLGVGARRQHLGRHPRHAGFVPRFIASRAEGHIVNTSSMVGVNTASGLAPYNVSKHGVVALSETLAVELEDIGSPVGVSVLCPGFVRTNIGASERNKPGVEPKPSGIGKGVTDLLDRGLQPAEVARMVSDAIKNEEFWIFTDPEMLAGVEQRMTRHPREPSPERRSTSKRPSASGTTMHADPQAAITPLPVLLAEQAHGAPRQRLRRGGRGRGPTPTPSTTPWSAVGGGLPAVGVESRRPGGHDAPSERRLRRAPGSGRGGCVRRGALQHRVPRPHARLPRRQLRRRDIVIADAYLDRLAEVADELPRLTHGRRPRATSRAVDLPWQVVCRRRLPRRRRAGRGPPTPPSRPTSARSSTRAAPPATPRASASRGAQLYAQAIGFIPLEDLDEDRRLVHAVPDAPRQREDALLHDDPVERPRS